MEPQPAIRMNGCRLLLQGGLVIVSVSSRQRDKCGPISGKPSLPLLVLSLVLTHSLLVCFSPLAFDTFYKCYDSARRHPSSDLTP